MCPHTIRTVRLTRETFSWKYLLQVRLTRPFIFFATEPTIQLFGLYLAFTYGSMYCEFRETSIKTQQPTNFRTVFLTAIPSIFQDVYGLPVGIAGLHYIPLGIGMYGGTVMLAKIMDRTYAAFKDRAGGVGKPEFRLRKAI